MIESVSPLEKVTCPYCHSDQVVLLNYSSASLKLQCMAEGHSWTVIYRQEDGETYIFVLRGKV